jgi:uncharacterized membrane protein YhaH (DUF805 family)
MERIIRNSFHANSGGKMNASGLKGNLRIIAFLLILLMHVSSAVASDGDACGTACGSFLFVIVAFFVLNIAILVWVAKDAKNRGMGGAVGWIFLILFTGVLGLIIYLFSRPTGDIVICEVCHNKKMIASRICPHCGNLAPSAPNSAGEHVDIDLPPFIVPAQG